MAASPGSFGGKLVLLIGPSGVGKSVILKTLRKRHPELHVPKSATTRPKRPNETDELYHFVTEAEFDALLKTDKLLEWAKVHAGASYGTMKEEILPHIEQGKVVLREVDVQGFDSIRQLPAFSGENAPYRMQSIFILPESKEQLIAHIQKRSPIEEDELRRRIRSMEKELEHADICDVKIINREGKMQEAVEEIEGAVFG